MRIKDLPWFNRPASKLRRKGVESLDDAELLAILFGKGCKEESALELSNRLLKKYNLNKFEELGFNELKKECNDDGVKALKILSLMELTKRCNRLSLKGYKISLNFKNLAQDVFNRFSDRLKSEKQEKFIILMLDNKNNVLGEQLISIGTTDSTLVNPKDIIKHALKCSAPRIILIHNHPTGDPTPSEADITLTDKMFEIGDMLGITLLDHVIIGCDKWWSWREEA